MRAMDGSQELTLSWSRIRASSCERLSPGFPPTLVRLASFALNLSSLADGH